MRKLGLNSKTFKDENKNKKLQFLESVFICMVLLPSTCLYVIRSFGLFESDLKSIFGLYEQL